MRSAAARAERAFHHPQSFPNSCQPACLAMALGRRASEAVADIEARLHVGADPRGHSVTERKWLREPRTSLLKSALDVSDFLHFREALARGAWVMVHVFGPRWVARLPTGCIGLHGALCPPSDAARPLHSVLIVAAGPRSFFALDPFHAGALQPFEVSETEWLAVLSGFSSLVVEA